jgi:hypothetical protein
VLFIREKLAIDIMSVEEVANEFIKHYYTTLDTNPAALAGLYVSIS